MNKNADFDGLTKYIKEFDFHSTVFNQPTVNQAEAYTDILKQAFAKFVPCKTVAIRPTDMPWCNSYTRLLLRKKNRNYQIFKKYICDYQNVLNQTNPKAEIVTRLLHRKNKAHAKAREAANDLTIMLWFWCHSFLHSVIPGPKSVPSLTTSKWCHYCCE